ncbi:hypothetical protein Bca4012_010412 [Brassica carinata]
MDQSAKGDNEMMDESTGEDVLAIPEGPITRSRSRQLKQAIGGLLMLSWKQEEGLGRSLINQDTLTTIQAIPSST